MKTLVKSTFCALYKYSGVMHAQERLAYWSGRRFMSILVFHRVTDEIPADGLTVTTHWFRRFCRLMRDEFHVVPLAEINRILQMGERPPRRTVAITFDDCYRDNLFAARVLKEHGLPACFFLPTNYVGTDHVFEWDKHLQKPLPNLTWADAAEMVQLGHEIGSHTTSHKDLGRLNPDEARAELTDSKKTLEDRLQRRVRYLAYPFGGRNNIRPEYWSMAQEIGYEACFSAHGGYVEPHMRGQILPRDSTPYFRSLLNLELHLTRSLEWIHETKRQVGLFA